MIRTARKVLQALLVQWFEQFDKTSMHTLLYEVIAIVTSRSITILTTDADNQCELPTRIHILTMKVSQSLAPFRDLTVVDVYMVEITCVKLLGSMET